MRNISFDRTAGRFIHASVDARQAEGDVILAVGADVRALEPFKNASRVKAMLAWQERGVLVLLVRADADGAPAHVSGELRQEHWSTEPTSCTARSCFLQLPALYPQPFNSLALDRTEARRWRGQRSPPGRGL